jgi:hypothetical protein
VEAVDDRVQRSPNLVDKALPRRWAAPVLFVEAPQRDHVERDIGSVSRCALGDLAYRNRFEAFLLHEFA